MRYRIFRDNRLCGPFSPAELLQIPGFSAETVVCPESCTGTNMTDWQRAGAAADFSEAFLKRAEPVAGGGEPAEKKGFSPELAARVEGLEERLAAFQAVAEKLDKRVSAEQGLEACVKQQSLAIEGLKSEIETLRGSLKRPEGAAAAPEMAAKLQELEAFLRQQGFLIERLRQEIADLRDGSKPKGGEAAEKNVFSAIEELRREIEALKPQSRRQEPAPDPAPVPAPAAAPWEPPVPAAAPEAPAPIVVEIPAAPRIFGGRRPEAGVPQKPEDKTILIVDDDESVLNLLEIFVRRDGFGIDLARTGEEALAKLESKPDALILDLMLPGASSGLDVLAQLRRRPGPVPPVIVITAYGNSKEVDAVKKDPNVVLFLPKPLNQAKLLGGLHNILNTRPPASPKKPAS